MRCQVVVLLSVCTLCFVVSGFGQDSTSLESKLLNLPDKLFITLARKSQLLEAKIERQTERYLERLEKQEKKLQKLISKQDTAAAKELFGNVSARYAKLKNTIANKQGAYVGKLDSMQTVFRFLQQKKLLDQSFKKKGKLESALASYNELQSKLNEADEVKKLLKERQQYLKEHLQKFGLTKELKRFQKDAYYYRAQVDEYRTLLDDPSRLESKILQLAKKIPAFRNFFGKHSILAAMFPTQGNAQATSMASIPGLQSRASTQQAMRPVSWRSARLLRC